MAITPLVFNCVRSTKQEIQVTSKNTLQIYWFSDLTLMVGPEEEHLGCNNIAPNISKGNQR